MLVQRIESLQLESGFVVCLPEGGSECLPDKVGCYVGLSVDIRVRFDARSVRIDKLTVQLRIVRHTSSKTMEQRRHNNNDHHNPAFQAISEPNSQGRAITASQLYACPAMIRSLI